MAHILLPALNAVSLILLSGAYTPRRILLSLILQPTILVPILVGMPAMLIAAFKSGKKSQIYVSNSSMLLFILSCYVAVVFAKIALLMTLFANAESYTSDNVLLVYKGALTTEAYKGIFRESLTEVMLIAGWFLLLKLINRLPNSERPTSVTS